MRYHNSYREDRERREYVAYADELADCTDYLVLHPSAGQDRQREDCEFDNWNEGLARLRHKCDAACIYKTDCDYMLRVDRADPALKYCNACGGELGYNEEPHTGGLGPNAKVLNVSAGCGKCGNQN